MGETMEFAIGSEVSCSDGVCEELMRLVVDPGVGTLTHLVVEPRHQGGAVCLASIELVDPARQGIRLRCTIAEYENSGTGTTAVGDLESAPPLGPGSGVVVHDRVPVGMVAVRRGERAHAVGDIGRIRGLIANRGDHRVTHLLLDEGFLWAKKRFVLPVSVVTHADDGVRLDLLKAEIRVLALADDEASRRIAL